MSLKGDKHFFAAAVSQYFQIGSGTQKVLNEYFQVADGLDDNIEFGPYLVLTD